MHSFLGDRTYPLWERLFSEGLTFRARLSGSTAIALTAFFITLGLYQHTGTYFSFIVIAAAFAISLFAGERLALVYATLLSIAGDYFFIPPIGGIFETEKSLEHFIILFSTSLATVLIIGTLRTAFYRLANAKKAADLATEQANRATDQMEKVLALVSHDVRNPLATSKLAAQMMLESPDRVDRHNFNVMIVRNLDRADALIQSLLDVTKMKTSGKTLDLQFLHCDLRTNISYLVEEISLTHRNRVSLKPGESVWGCWGADGIKRAVENLITNALKYGSLQHPVEVDVCRQNDQAVISVRNLGNEIPKEEQDKLFDFFHRAESTVLGSQQGWGIGLAVVKAVAEAHGGSVQVESGMGWGTRFVLTLPSQEATEQAPDQVI